MDQLQASLHSEFAVHEAICKTIPGISGIVQCLPSDPNASAFDDLDNDEPMHDDNAVSETQDQMIPNFLRPVTMSSTLQLPYSILKLTLRKQQANRHLNLLNHC